MDQVRARSPRPARPPGRREFRAAPAEAPPERPAASGDGAGPRPDLDRLATAVWVFDVDGSRMLWANAAALEVWDAASLDELRARDFGADMSAPVARKFRQFQQDCRRPGVRFSEVCTHYPRGVPRTMLVTVSGILLPDGRMGLVGEAVDYPGGSPDMLRSTAALVQTSVMIGLYGADGRAFYRNPAARRAAESGDCRLPSRFVDPRDYEALVGSLAAAREARLVAEVRTSAGARWHEITAVSSADPATGARACLISEVDVTELKAVEARVTFAATHDELTGLPNRALFRDRLGQALALARRDGGRAAVLLLDLDDFKGVNDSLGHPAGDALLRGIAGRLGGVIRGSDTLARLGGDEFALVQLGARRPGDAATLAAKLLAVLEAPFDLGGQEVHAAASVGVALFPGDGDDPDELVRRADLALYRAKGEGRGRFRFFEPAMDEEVRARQRLQQELRRALERGQFLLHYQPQLGLTRDAAAGVEALLRWRHPTRGLVPPGEFVPAAEASGLIVPLGAWALREACRQAAAWRRQGLALTVAVNVSPVQLRHPDLLDVVDEALAASGLEPGRLELEVTEGLLVESDGGVAARLAGLAARGVGLAIDDFGTGYSSLAYLKRLPARKIKVDRSFVRDIGADPEHEAVVRAIVSLGHALGKDVVAEGVETEAQLAFLRALGCDAAQGFLLARPRPAAELDLGRLLAA